MHLFAVGVGLVGDCGHRAIAKWSDTYCLFILCQARTTISLIFKIKLTPSLTVFCKYHLPNNIMQASHKQHNPAGTRRNNDVVIASYVRWEGDISYNHASILHQYEAIPFTSPRLNQHYRFFSIVLLVAYNINIFVLHLRMWGFVCWLTQVKNAGVSKHGGTHWHSMTLIDTQWQVRL